MKELKRLYRSDIDKIKSMTYIDVQNEKREISEKRKQTALKVASTTAKTAGALSLWRLKMSLTGVRIYGTMKAATFLGEMGMKAINWLQTDEGVKIAARAGAVTQSYVKAGDAFLSNNADFLNSISTASISSLKDVYSILQKLKV